MRTFYIGVLTFAMAVGLGADNQLRDMAMTLDGPVEIPGYFTWDEGIGRAVIINDVLSAGNYMLRVAESSADRAIIRVTDLDGARVYATLMAVPELERRVPIPFEVTFFEADGRFPSLHAWHRGGRLGWAFVYPKEQAREIARKTGLYVIAAEDAASGPWIAQAERIKGLLAEPLVMIYPDGTELPLPEHGGNR
jgi:hypothetical protein